MNRLPILIFALAGLFATSCNGIFEGIYDELPADSSSDEGFSMTPSEPNRLTLTLDASDFATWTYVSLKKLTVEKFAIPLTCEGEWDGCSAISYHRVNGDEYTLLSSTPTDTQSEPSEWDLALHRFDVRTNGGAACRTDLTSIDDAPALSIGKLEFTPDTWSDSRVMVDLTDMMSYRIGYQNISSNSVLSEWVKMDISCPPPTFTSSGLVYIVRLADGSMAAMQMRSYISPRGVKGHLTIDIIYPL